MEVGLYNYENIFKQAKDRLNNETTISNKNKEYTKQFINNCLAEGLSKARVIKYIYSLRNLGKMINVDFDKATNQDIKELVGKIELNNWANDTKRDHKIALKKFYKSIFGDGEDYPDIVKHVKTTKKENGHKIPEVITEEDVKAMLKATYNARDRCLISCLFDSGMRIGELASARLKHCKFLDDDTAEITAPESKTMARRVLLIPSTPYLRDWIQQHPTKNNPESFLFVGLGKLNYAKRMQYGAFYRLLQKIAKRAGITKKVNPHNFRKGSATAAASYLSESQLDERFGWVIGSKVKRVYIHLAGKNVDDAYRKMHGKNIKEENKDSMLKPIKCKICDFVNGAGANFCGKCLKPLNIKVAMEQQKKKEISVEIESAITQDPRYQKILEIQSQIFKDLMQKNPEFKTKIDEI